MHQETRDQVDWKQPFPHEEYVSRQNKVRHALTENGISGIFVTSPADLTYLFGYDQIWYSLDTLCSCFLPADGDGHVFFDNDGHVLLVSIYPEITDVCIFDRGKVADQIPVIAGEVIGRGWAKGKIAIQPRCYGPHPNHVRKIGAIW